jgi:hypothetical protein
MPTPLHHHLARPAAALAIALTLGVAACGGSTPTATPAPTATPVPVPTATSTPRPTAAVASPVSGGGTATRATGSPAAGSGTPNPVAVTSAYANLLKQDSYRLVIKADGVGTLLPLGIGNTLTYVIDANGGNQKIVIDDGSGTKQEGYKIGGKYYLIQNGQATEMTSLPLLFTLPDLLYNAVTAPGVMTFTAAGSEQVNGRATTKYNGTGQVASLSSNPIFALALPNAQGNINGPIWVDSQGNFLVAGDLTLNLTAPQIGTARLRLDVTKVGQVGPITAPK